MREGSVTVAVVKPVCEMSPCISPSAAFQMWLASRPCEMNQFGAGSGKTVLPTVSAMAGATTGRAAQQQQTQGDTAHGVLLPRNRRRGLRDPLAGV